MATRKYPDQLPRISFAKEKDLLGVSGKTYTRHPFQRSICGVKFGDGSESFLLKISLILLQRVGFP